MNSYKTLAWCGVMLAASAVCQADVVLKKEPDRIRIEIDGKPYGDLMMEPDGAKPYFYPLRSASGKIVSRQWPMVADSNETKDHQHHRSLWVGYLDVNGINFWENELTYKKPNLGRIVPRSVEQVKSGKKAGTLKATFDWIDPKGNKVLTEHRTMVIHTEPNLRMIDIDVTLTAVVQARFGDDKDGTFGVRVSDQLRQPAGGVMTNSLGGRLMKEVWGKPADWVDYSGTVDGEEVGIAIFDHPSSFRHPARWHARDYGLFAVNPFGVKAYDPSQPASEVVLEPGKSLRLRYRVVIHPKMDQDGIQKLYQQWAAEK